MAAMPLADRNNSCFVIRRHAPTTGSDCGALRPIHDACRQKGGRAMARNALPRAFAFEAPRNFLMAADVTAQYAARVAAGEIERDASQERVLDLLAQLELRLREHRQTRLPSPLGWLFGGARERDQEAIRGLYIFGEVGRGKKIGRAHV